MDVNAGLGVIVVVVVALLCEGLEDRVVGLVERNRALRLHGGCPGCFGACKRDRKTGRDELIDRDMVGG